MSEKPLESPRFPGSPMPPLYCPPVDHAAAAKERPSRTVVAGTVTFYLLAGITMLFANKWVLNNAQVPLLFLLLQTLMAVVLLHVAEYCKLLTLPSIRLSTCRSVTPLICTNTLGLIFNTYCLEYVDASFYQVARGLALPMTVLVSYLLSGYTPSKPILYSVGIVCVGFLCGTLTELRDVSSLGVWLGIASSLTLAVHVVVVKATYKTFPAPLDLVYYTNVLSAIALIPLLFFSDDLVVFQAMYQFGSEDLKTFGIGLGITGSIGFLLSLAGFWSIKITSPVTHVLSQAFRGSIQTILGMLLFGDILTPGRLLGIFAIVSGSIMYTLIRDRESSTSTPADPDSECLLPLSPRTPSSPLMEKLASEMD